MSTKSLITNTVPSAALLLPFLLLLPSCQNMSATLAADAEEAKGVKAALGVDALEAQANKNTDDLAAIKKSTDGKLQALDSSLQKQGDAVGARTTSTDVVKLIDASASKFKPDVAAIVGEVGKQFEPRLRALEKDRDALRESVKSLAAIAENRRDMLASVCLRLERELLEDARQANRLLDSIQKDRAAFAATWTSLQKALKDIGKRAQLAEEIERELQKLQNR